MATALKTTMDALCYHTPGEFNVISVPIPQITDNEVLVKVSLCGSCGSDSLFTDGAFGSKFPLIPGHEVVGTVAKVGRAVQGFSEGDRCVANPIFTCEICFYCRRGQIHLCENFRARGVHMAGGFAEYVAFPGAKVFTIHNLTDEEATLVEPTSCAIHGIDKLNSPAGIEALVLGAGPSGLVLAQLLKLNGATKVVIAANKGIKTRIAQELNAGDDYIELERDPETASAQWAKIKEDYPYGFDVVVDATGSAKVAGDAINYVRRGGTLLLYCLYSDGALVHWAPSKIFGDEIRIIGSVGQGHCFPRAVAYLESGKINVKGMVTDTFTIKEYQKAVDTTAARSALKIAIRPQ